MCGLPDDRIYIICLSQGKHVHKLSAHFPPVRIGFELPTADRLGYSSHAGFCCSNSQVDIKILLLNVSALVVDAPGYLLVTGNFGVTI